MLKKWSEKLISNNSNTFQIWLKSVAWQTVTKNNQTFGQMNHITPFKIPSNQWNNWIKKITWFFLLNNTFKKINNEFIQII